jgi:glycosyltransferase involved in cell wall biosynthesis
MITIIFSSYNGARTLPRMLEGLCALRSDGLRYKVVAVDNGSTDDTSRILKAYGDRLPLTCLFEPRRGKNIALNRALAEIEGDLVLMTDDDVLVAPDWLLQVKAVFEAHPEVDVVGGRVEPLWPSPPAPWILTAVPLVIAYASTPADYEDGPCGPQRVWGPNMSFRARLFRDGRRFNERIGPDGTKAYAMGAEVEFCRRLQAEGRKMWHCPRAVVQHIIRDYQLTRRWLGGRAYRHGRGETRMAPNGGGDPSLKRVMGVPRYLLPMIARAAGAYVWTLARRDPAAQIEALWSVAYLAGVAHEMQSIHRTTRQTAANASA